MTSTMKEVHFEHPRHSKTGWIGEMYRPRIFPAKTDFFNKWDSIQNVTFKDRSRGERYILNKIPAKLIGFMIPGPGMGHIRKSDTGRKLIIDVTSERIVSFIE